MALGLMYYDQKITMNFDINAWKSNNSALEKKICNAIAIYVIYIPNTALIILTSRITDFA